MNVITRGTQVRGVLECTPTRRIYRNSNVKKSVKTLLVSSALLALMCSGSEAQVPDRSEPPAGIRPPAGTEPAVERFLGLLPNGRWTVPANVAISSGCQFGDQCLVETLFPCVHCTPPQ